MKTRLLLLLAAAGLAAGLGIACKGSPAPPPAEQHVAKDEALPALAKVDGLPVRHLYLQQDLEPNKAIDTGEAFALDGVVGGALVQTGKDAARAQFSVRELDGTTHLITRRAGSYVEPNLFMSPSLRALCATEVTLIDRGPAPIGHAYAYDTKAGSRLLCWVNAADASKDQWEEIEIASTVATEPHDMIWSFALTGSRSEPTFDVVYAQDAEWTPQYFHAIGRQEREKGFERTIRVTGGKASLETLVDGEFPDFSILQARSLPGANACSGQCGSVWDGRSWHECGGCGSGEACVGGVCQAGKKCTPLTKEKACDALACGKYSDGCGGRVDCGDTCQGGLTCGADGTFRRCGKRLHPKTVDEVRAMYGDKDNQLCGVFLDPETGSNPDLGACQSPEHACVKNLCLPKP